MELRKTGNFLQSSKLYRKCLKVAPDNEVIKFNYGRVILDMGKHDQARKVFNDVLRINQHNERARKIIDYLDNLPLNDENDTISFA